MLLLDKNEVTPEEYQIWKKARKTAKHLIKHEKNSESIITVIGKGIDIVNGQFSSQDLLDRYNNCYMGDSDEE